MAHSEHLTPEQQKAKIMKIWKVAGYMALITAVEFILAFTMERSLGLNILYIILTIAKAFFIVAEFMHLGHEAKVLVWSILLPMIFVVWLVTVLIYEGGALFQILGVR